MADTHIQTILLIAMFLILTYVAGKLKKQEGFYLSFFPPNKNDKRTTLVDDKDAKADSTIYGDQHITFQFPKDTPREAMVTYVGHFFKSKMGGTYKNVIDVQVERNGPGKSDFEPQTSLTNLNNKITDRDYDQVYLIIGYIEKDKYKNSDFGTSNRTKYITTPQTMKYERIPLEFTRDSVRIVFDKKQTPMPVMYFMHYWFDPFYCKGKYEKQLQVDGWNQKDISRETIHKYVVPVDNMEDCKWGGDSQLETCRINKDVELIPDTISVEPDSNTQNRKYKTPYQKDDRCLAQRTYFKKWDARGVPIERSQKDIDMKEYIYHPGLVQNKLDGLYDDVFDMSRIIPSYPTGRASSGR